eukprot:11137181-Alexandrium_andersonii.AAC.1
MLGHVSATSSHLSASRVPRDRASGEVRLHSHAGAPLPPATGNGALPWGGRTGARPTSGVPP